MQAEDLVLSPLQRATTEFSYYMTKKTASALQISLTRLEGLIHYWINTGKRDFPVLAVVAMAQLETPPGSVVLENDLITSVALLYPYVDTMSRYNRYNTPRFRI